MKLNKQETEFLCRLLGHHVPGSNVFLFNLYMKFYKSSRAIGVDKNTLDTPLQLSLVEFGNPNPVFFRVEDANFQWGKDYE